MRFQVTLQVSLPAENLLTVRAPDFLALMVHLTDMSREVVLRNLLSVNGANDLCTFTFQVAVVLIQMVLCFGSRVLELAT